MNFKLLKRASWTTLYLGLDPTHYKSRGKLIHYPVIEIIPKTKSDVKVQQAFSHFSDYTHVIFTSRNAVKVFFYFIHLLKIPIKELKKKNILAIGPATAAELYVKGVRPIVAEVATQEGIVEELKKLSLKKAFFLLPRASLSRPVITAFLEKHKVEFQVCDLYDTVLKKPDPIPNLEEIDELVFTSPSTVEGFIQIFSSIPKNKKISTLGPITQEYLKNYLEV